MALAKNDLLRLGHCLAVDRHGVRFILLDVPATTCSGKNKVDRKVYQPSGRTLHDLEHCGHAVDVHALCHSGIQLARFELTSALTVEHSGEVMLIEQPGQR